MAYIKRPQRGQKTLQSLFDSVNSIIDYLPSITVRGDNNSTYVEHSSNGTVIHAKQSYDTDQFGGKGKEYYAGSGLNLVSGNIFESALSGDLTGIQIIDNVITLVGGSGGTITIVDNFGVPNLSALNYNNEPLATSGDGISWLIPVSAGQRITFATGASGNVNASYAPAKGKSGSSFALTRDILSTIPQDGYVRITAFDDGLHPNQCLRILDGTTDWNKGLPLYKFGNWSSGTIYVGGRYTDIQTTSTRINSQTGLEEQYTLDNPIINNMLSGGAFIQIQETDGNDVALEYPLINCTLTGLDQLANTPGFITNSSVQSSLPYFAGSGLVSSALLDQEDNLTGIQFGLSSQFYNALSTIVEGRPANKVLSSNAQSGLVWADNTGGSPSPGGTGTISACFITEQGEYTVQPNLKYIVMTAGDLSSNVDMPPTTDKEYYDADNLYRIYKYFIISDPAKIVTTEYDSSTQQYGGYYNDDWEQYNGQGFGTIFNLTSGATNCNIQIVTHVLGNCLIYCTDTKIVDMHGSIISGYNVEDWLLQIGEGNSTQLSYDAAQNTWYLNYV